MKHNFLSFFLLLFLFGCSSSDYQRILSIPSSTSKTKAIEDFAKYKTNQYIKNPNALKSDIKSLENIQEAFSSLVKEASKKWGTQNVLEPKPKEYVKYFQDYKSRAMIDYQNSLIRIETIDKNTPKESLKKAIVMALLLPHDPTGKDLFDSDDVKLGEEPYLYNEVLDNEGKPVRWEWRAQKFADYLIKNRLKTKQILDDNKNKQVVNYVEIPMSKQNQQIRAHKYQDIVKIYAKKYNLSESLISAIIQTESNFNQYAISRTGAVGLMQIMPKTAGADAYQVLYNKKGTPTKEYLFDPKNNIEMGSVYLDILKNRYLSNIKNTTSKEYCVISAYNGGSGTVLNAFDKSSKTNAFNKINSLNTQQVYQVLTTKVAFDETRRYLVKVLEAKKSY